MLRYLCMNPACLYSSHLTPDCPYRVPRALPYTAAQDRSWDHIQKLHREGVLSAPPPGTEPVRSWFVPILLPILLPLALFLFFVFVLLAG